MRTSVADRMGSAFLVILSPGVFFWTLYCFWRLAMKGTLFVRDHGRVIEVSGGFNFWVTLAMYFVFLLGSLVVFARCVGWLLRKVKGG